MESDAPLIAQARSGDEEALVRLVEAYAPRILRFSRKVCRDEQDAEEVLQQTLLTVVSHIGDFRGESQFTSWLYAIARSHCIKQRTRGAARVPTEVLDPEGLEIAAPGNAPDEQVGKAQLEMALEAAIRALEPSQREVLVLRDVEGLSAQEVADALGVQVGAVKSRLHRARKALRDRVAPWLEQSAPGPSCPDVVDLLSRYQEGDVTSEVCRTMEAHVDGCAACAARCHSLRSVLSACSTSPLPEIPESLKRAVREQIHRSLKRQKA